MSTRTATGCSRNLIRTPKRLLRRSGPVRRFELSDWPQNFEAAFATRRTPSGRIDIFHRMVWQVPSSVWLRILHFHRFDIVFLKVCQESLIVFFLQQRFTLNACVEAFDWFQCRTEVVFHFISDFQGSLISYLSLL